MYFYTNPKKCRSPKTSLYTFVCQQHELSHLPHKEIDPRVPSWVLCNRAPSSSADSRTFYPCRRRSCNRSRLAARIRRRDCSNGCQTRRGPGRARRQPRAARTGNSDRRRTRVLHARWPCSACARVVPLAGAQVWPLTFALAHLADLAATNRRKRKFLVSATACRRTRRR